MKLHDADVMRLRRMEGGEEENGDPTSLPGSGHLPLFSVMENRGSKVRSALGQIMFFKTCTLEEQ